MTIFLQTGLPGEGKTLVTLDTLYKEQLQETKLHEKDPDTNPPVRPVYYYNLELSEKGAKLLGWRPLTLEQAQRWYELPAGSKILIDECQKIFRPQRQGAEKPQTYTELEEHRHKGFDIYLITQSSKLIDISVRELVGFHKYIERRFNSSQTTLWTSKGCKPEAMLKKDPRCDQVPYKHNKKIFPLYKSAEMHTIKTKIPKKLLVLIPLMGFLLFVGITLFNRGMSSFGDDEIEQGASSQAGGLADRDTEGLIEKIDGDFPPDTLRDGMLKGRKVFLTGVTQFGLLFNVNGITMTGNDLKALSYVIVRRGNCFAIINRTPITCAPPDYWGDEYGVYEFEDKRKRDNKRKPNKKEKITKDT